MCASSRMFLLAAFVSCGQAFSPNSFSSVRTRASTAGCYLTIKDGNDLVAASQEVYRPVQVFDEDGDDLLSQGDLPMASTAVELEPSLITAPRGVALSFVKRLFAQPTAAFHPHEAEGLDGYPGEEQEDGDDVVYFPVVGFTFVRDGPNHCRALPNVSNPSCRIRGDVFDHAHYGTWTPSA